MKMGRPIPTFRHFISAEVLKKPGLTTDSRKNGILKNLRRNARPAGNQYPWVSDETLFWDLVVSLLEKGVYDDLK